MKNSGLFPLLAAIAALMVLPAAVLAVPIGYSITGTYADLSSGGTGSFTGMFSLDADAPPLSGPSGSGAFVFAIFDAMVTFNDGPFAGLEVLQGPDPTANHWMQAPAQGMFPSLANFSIGNNTSLNFGLQLAGPDFPGGAGVLAPPRGAVSAIGELNSFGSLPLFRLTLDATIAPKPAGVPESGSTIAMLGMVFGGLVLRRRR